MSKLGSTGARGQTPTVMSGARAIFMIGGSRIAFASNVNFRITYSHSPIAVLGRFSVAGHEPTGHDVTFSCGSFRVADKSAQSLGIQPKVNDILNQEGLLVTIIDRKTNKTILKITNVRLIDRAGGMGSRDIATETWDFVGIIASDEAEDGIPDETALDANQPYRS